MIIDAPCRTCTERSVNCHDRCQRYKSYRKKLDSIREKDAEKRRIDNVVHRRRKNNAN